MTNIVDKNRIEEILKNQKLNLGCGKDFLIGYINHDLKKHDDGVDIIFNLNDKNWSGEFRNEFAFGPEPTEYADDNYTFLPNQYNEIRAWDVIEHLNDPINFMDNCWKLLKKDGVLDLKACGWENPNFNVDITHKGHGYDMDSFDYFDPDTKLGQEYGYYTDKRWKILEKKYDKRKNILIKLTPIK